MSHSGLVGRDHPCPIQDWLEGITRVPFRIGWKGSPVFHSVVGFSSFTSAKYSLTQCEGVTFLAFGNGAPDVFSAIAAIGSAKAGDAGLAIGALFGEWLFCGV